MGRSSDTKEIRQIVFNISQNFKVTKILGEGAYGIVALAIHIPTGTKVAIKKIEPFDRPLFCLRTLREIKLLNKFKFHENIIRLYDVQKPLDYDHFNEVYLIQEYMPSDLHHIIHTHVLSDQHIQYFIYQILKGLKLIHSARVIHRDLKPSNILVNEQCDLKICDFGLARLDAKHYNLDCNSQSKISMLTEYVATRWYRAPEIMLSASNYSTAIDIWSVGCILAELLTYTPLFPGTDYINQLKLIFEVLGTPSEEDLEIIKSERAKKFIRSLPFRSKIDLDNFINNHPYRRVKVRAREFVNPLAIDLLDKLLVFDPSKRISAEEALAHPYLKTYHDPSDEPVTVPIPVEEFEFDTDKKDLEIGDLKRQIFEQITTIK
ncbi:Mitogen-activated protein kinase [Candida maltosa Xu316]|uniref:Mitogen-activated protein kinase n=1 Tax=Candida maltosa (strain Xu316) TaxID=1245528 RepID=M3IQS9_CANMX|nr:Mitogen-activated protein kinase [Candida maltosa Xu316]